jgi:hypothetical protein
MRGNRLCFIDIYGGGSGAVVVHPEAQINLESDGKLKASGTYLVDNSRLRQEFDIEYPPFRT